MPNYPDFYLPAPYLVSVAEAARGLGVKPYPVYELCESGELPHGRIGQQIVIPVEAVRQYAERVAS